MEFDESHDCMAKQVSEYLGALSGEGREKAIEEIRNVLYEAMMPRNDAGTITCCPHCKKSDIIRFGKTSAGDQRYRCKSCGKTFSVGKYGMLLRLSKLPPEKWSQFAECFVDGNSSTVTAEKIDVTQKTAWYMRARTFQALAAHIPSFELKEGSDVQVDEIYFEESFKGVSLKQCRNIMPREPHVGENYTVSRGISNEKICVVTGINDLGDFFYEVLCRGALTNEGAERTLEKRITAGTIVYTDRHKAYPKVLKDLHVALHKAIPSKIHDPLSRVNHLHSDIRGFLKRFHGVSSKWLEGYLMYFKWRKTFCSDVNVGQSVSRSQFSSGDYQIRRRFLGDMPLPFRDKMGRPTKY